MYVENIVIGNPLADPSSMLAKDEDDWNSVEKEKTYFTDERFLPRILVNIGIYPSVNEIRRNKPELMVTMDKLNFIDCLKVSKKRKVWILVGRWSEINLVDFYVTEIISEQKDKVWKLYGMSEQELEKEKVEAKNTLLEQGWIEHLLSDGLKQKYKYSDDGGEFVEEKVFNLTRGDVPYFIGYVGQH